MVIKNRTAGYSAIQSFFWMGYAGIMGFVSLYLLHAGFDNAQVGLLIAAAGLLSALLQPVVAAYADRPGEPKPRARLKFIFSPPFTVAIPREFTRGVLS